jgi:superfamily I DNA/RNA helicase
MSDRAWSTQQQDIFKWFQGGSGNLVVRARAGTGKTTTILEAINHAPETSILLAAFNKRIADELKLKVKRQGAEAKTLHSLGLNYVTRAWGKCDIDSKRGYALAKMAIREVMKCGEAPDPMVRLVAQLASKGKSILPLRTNAHQLEQLALQFDLLPEQEWEEAGYTMEKVAYITIRAMTFSLEELTPMAPKSTIDFDDMLYIPVARGLVRPRYDMVVIDEAQDMNATQLLLAQGACRRGGRIVVVGDDRQAIYGFRGADSDSLNRLKKELKAEELGLTTTYRCPKTVVAVANNWVTDYQAAPEAPEGRVTTLNTERLLSKAAPGDYVLSRTNAPLVGICLKLLKAGTKARIEGRDIGAGLLKVIKNIRTNTMANFMKKLSEWKTREIARLAVADSDVAEARQDLITDQYETIVALCDGVKTINELVQRTESLFTDICIANAVTCSSVHKAKGLEANRVFVLLATLRSTSLEEQNICYVAVTRAKAELVWVDENWMPSMGEEAL